MNNEPYGWVKNGEYVLYIEKPDSVFNYIPLYTHQYERPHNTVLVPCDKLAEMQAEIDVLKQQILMWENADVPTEVMAEVIIELEKRGFIEKTKKAQKKCPPASWWKGDPTCGGLTENYGLEKAQK